MSVFIPGQRWVSESEPELGLGTVVQTGGGRVQVAFKAAGETRVYTDEQAPLKRLRASPAFYDRVLDYMKQALTGAAQCSAILEADLHNKTEPTFTQLGCDHGVVSFKNIKIRRIKAK